MSCWERFVTGIQDAAYNLWAWFTTWPEDDDDEDRVVYLEDRER